MNLFNKPIEQYPSFGLGESILYSYYVKYDRLTALINEEFKGSDANNLNIIIDLYDIKKSLYKRSKDNETMFKTNFGLSSSIINMCAHYRHFFDTRYGVQTKIFLIDAEPDENMYKSIYDEYNNMIPKVASKFKTYVNSNMELLKQLCLYIPQVQYIDTKYETGVRIIEIITKESAIEISQDKPFSQYTPYLLITKDIVTMSVIRQYPGILHVLRPKKSKGNDLSYIVNFWNIIDIYAQVIRNNKPIPNGEFDFSLVGNHINTLLALTKIPERGITKGINVNKAIRGICNSIDAYEKDHSINSYTSYLENTLMLNFNTDLKEKVLNPAFMYYEYCMNPELNAYNGIVDLFDPDEIKRINNYYYKDCPLDLNVL